MNSFPHSKSALRTYTTIKLHKSIQSNTSFLNNDINRYEDLIKKARATINKFQNNSKSISKEKQLNTSPFPNLERKSSNYSLIVSSQRESRDDIKTEYSNLSNFGIENYYKNLINQLKSDLNIQNEKMRNLENINKQNEINLSDNERERGRLEDKVKNLKKKLNETKILYEDLKEEKKNLENNYEQLRFNYKNDLKNKEEEEILSKENEMIKSELNKFIKENINLKISVKNLKQEIGNDSNEVIINLKKEIEKLNSQLESKEEKIKKLEKENLKKKSDLINLSNEDIMLLVNEEKEKYKKLKEEYDLFKEENKLNENKCLTENNLSNNNLIDKNKYYELQKNYSNLLLENQGLKKKFNK